MNLMLLTKKCPYYREKKKCVNSVVIIESENGIDELSSYSDLWLTLRTMPLGITLTHLFRNPATNKMV